MVVAVAVVVEHHLLGLGIDIHHLAQQDLDIGGMAHHLAQGRGHIALRHQSRGHLIEQGLEQVEVAFIDQGDAHRLAGQGMAGLEASKATAHNHHMGPGRLDGGGWIQFQEEMFGRHATWGRVASTVCSTPMFGCEHQANAGDCPSGGPWSR